MGRKHLILAIAVVLAVVLGGVIWAGSAAGPGGRQQAAPGSNVGSPTAPGAGDAGAAASDDATSTTPAGPPDAATPSDAATPTDPAAAPSDPDATAPSAGASAPADAALPAPDSLPARSASSCDGLKTALADYQAAGQKSGPAGFQMLLMGLDDLSGSAEIMASTDDMYQPVVEGITQVRRQWSTSSTAYEDGSAETAAKEAQNGIDTLKAADDGLLCR